MKGIDVSKWQGNVDFNAVAKSGIEFVIIRAGYGRISTQKDSKFDQNYCNAKAAGLKVGAYWYSYAADIEDAKREAAACLEVLQGKQFDFPIYYDIEENSQLTRGAEFCSGIAHAFCEALEKAGYFAGIYSSKYHLENSFDAETVKRFAVWVAQWNDTCTYNSQYGIWQYSDKGRVIGIIGAVDLDEAVIDYSEIIVKGGFNGYPKSQDESKPAETPKEKESDYIEYLIKDGDTLSEIAAKYGTTVKKLQKLNNIKNIDLIYAGEKLKIPKV